MFYSEVQCPVKSDFKPEMQVSARILLEKIEKPLDEAASCCPVVLEA
jgi:hypothetical protein